MSDATQQFASAITAAGLPAPDVIEADGALHRFSTNGKRGDDSGWYVLHGDGVPAGAFGCWRLGVTETWRADIGRELTAGEREAHRARVAAMRKEREEQEKQLRQSAAEQARTEWSSAQEPTTGHPYLEAKGVAAHGLRLHGSSLLVPVADQFGNLHGLQSIAPDGAKRFNPGAAVAGHFHLIGDPNGRLYLAEGYATAATIHEATGAAVACCFNAGNLGPVAKVLRDAHPDAELVMCADDDQWTEGNPGRTKALAAAAAVGGSVVAPRFRDTNTKPTDFNDLARLEGLEAVRSQLQQEQRVEESVEAAVERLATLAPLEYEQVREQEAKTLGVRVGALDKEVYQRRQNTDGTQDTTPLVEEVEPWPAPVDGAELAVEIRATLTRYMVLPDGAPEALTLWTIGSYTYDAFRIWPKLTITSPEKRCGKSTLMTGLLAPLVHRGLVASNISSAAIYRVIEAWTPTLLIDEADTFLNGNDELRGVINSGHTKSGAFVVRTVGDDHEPKKFSTWAPMAIAMIKTPAGTILDRSVVIQLRRRLPGEQVEKLPLAFEDACLALRRRCKRWADDHVETLRQAEPRLPQSANDRALDNWTPLLAIAETLGGEWPAQAVTAFGLLTITDDDDAIGPMILEDIRRVFEEHNRDRLHSVDLVTYLIELEERPWSEWRRGKPLTTTSLARLLKPFRIKSKQLWIGGTNRHGYDLADFRDSFGRYLTPSPCTPPTQDARTLDPSNGAASSEIQNARPSDDLAFTNSRKPSNGAGSSVLAFQTGGVEQGGYVTDDCEFEEEL